MMPHDQKSAGTGVILVTLMLAAWLEVLPLPDMLVYLRPEWLALTLVYWVIALPHRIGVFWGFGTGLFMDVLVGAVLGQHALAFAVIAWVSALVHKRMRVFPPPQQSLVVFMLVGAAVLINWLVQDALGRAHLAPWLMLLSAVTSALLWRPVYGVLRWVRRRFLVR